MLVTASGEILAANRACFERLEGLSRTEGLRLQDLVSKPPEEVAVYLQDCCRSRQLVLGSLRFQGAKDAWRCEGVVYRPRTEDSPAVVLLRLQPRETVIQRFLLLNERIDALNREVGRRRAAEAALNNQREWLRVTLESIGDAVIATDSAGSVSFLNPTAEALTGWSQGEAIGRPLYQIFNIVNEDTRKPVESPVEKVLREGIVVGLANHTVLIARDGREVPIDDSAAPIRGVDGEFLGVVMVFHDISERRAFERELRLRADRLMEANRRKDEFLAMLGHELRNPLAPIRNALHLMRMPSVGAEAIERVRQMMERQVEHMVRLVDDLLDVSRITRGKIELRRERVDMTALVRSTVEGVEGQVKAKSIDLQLRVPAEPIFMEADPTRLDQVLTNLLNNALKFTPSGGLIEVVVQREANCVRLSVRDTGVGIEPELLPEIFEPFLQGSRSLDRSQGGLGIGLTLVRSLVGMHGGSVQAQSDGPGKGSEFVVLLPLDPSQESNSRRILL